MESIKRNIYVLRNAIKEKIEITKGTDMIPIELNVVDYNIPDYAIAVAYALGQTSDVPKKILCDVGNNAIKFTPSESFFEVGRNELMVRVLKDEKKLFTFSETVICKDSTIKINDASEAQDPSLVEQLLNKMSNEAKDRLVLQSEVEDIRKGYDETVYKSAGEAVRGQIANVKDDMSKMRTNLSEEISTVKDNVFNLKSALATPRAYTPKLLTASGREITQDKAGGYAVGYYIQIGNIVLFYFQVKTKITENGERAKISLPVEETGASYGATFVVSESGGLTDSSAGRGELRGDGMITLLSEDEGNGNIGYSNVYWKNTGQAGYIKMSGFYFV